MRTFNKSQLALGVAAGMAMLAASTGAQASSAGTDLNLSAHAAAGGMAGAAYTKPQEVSAAIAGNPATLTQFPGVNFNFGAALISLKDIEVEMEGSAAAGAVQTNSRHVSDADNYIVPTLGLGLQVSPNLFLGLGLEADAGLGADYRNDGIDVTGGLLEAVGLPATSIPLLVEVISFNANLGAGYKVSDVWSVGGTITVGFGLAQLGTAGPTSGLDLVSAAVVDPALAALGVVPAGTTTGLLADFGGTTSSVHDIGFGWTLGTTYELSDTLMTSLTVKSPVDYSFQDIIYESGTLLNGNQGQWSNLDVGQPLEVIAGLAWEEGNLLVETDVIWKNWADADAYEDAYDDQFVIAIGGQYTMNNWQFRAGYTWAEEILLDEPNNTLGGLTGLGTIPIGTAADSAGPAGTALATDVIDLVQMSLLPVLYEHSISGGVGYNFTDAVRVDAFVSYAFGEEESRDLETLTAVVNASGAMPVTVDSITANQNLDYELFVGAGINIALP